MRNYYARLAVRLLWRPLWPAAQRRGEPWWIPKKALFMINGEKAYLATGAYALTHAGCELYTAPPNGTLIPDEGARPFC